MILQATNRSPLSPPPSPLSSTARVLRSALVERELAKIFVKRARARAAKITGRDDAKKVVVTRSRCRVTRLLWRKVARDIREKKKKALRSMRRTLMAMRRSMMVTRCW